MPEHILNLESTDLPSLLFGYFGSFLPVSDTALWFVAQVSRICHLQVCHEVVFSADEAVRRCKDGEKVILVRIETSPDDIHGLHAAEGVLTTRGRLSNRTQQ